VIEHPTGDMEVFLDIGPDGRVKGAGTIRTSRKLFDGIVFPS
jgi:4-oxalomesaconate tautomerase